MEPKITDGKAVNLKLTEADLRHCEVIKKKFGHISRCAAIRFALKVCAEAEFKLSS